MDFHIREFEDIILSTREGTSLGNNLINHFLLKLSPPITIQKLLQIFNNILREASFLHMWRNYDIILLSKPNKSDFRPIALSSCVLKLLEKLIKSRLERLVELDLLLPCSQYDVLNMKSREIV